MADFKKTVKVIALISPVLIIILSISLPFASISKVDSTQVGLDYDSLTIKIDENNLYSSGQYFIGYTHSFIKFP